MNRTKDHYLVLHFLTLLLCAVLLVVLFSRGVALSRLLIEKHKKLIATECMGDTEKKLIELINRDLKATADTVYEPLLKEVRDSDGTYTDKEAAAVFYDNYEKLAGESYGQETIIRTLNGYLAGLSKEDDSVRHMRISGTPVFDIKRGDQGEITGCMITRLNLEYVNADEVITAKRYDSNLSYPKAFFYSGNDGLFDYPLIALKGLYITGNTSSVIGNVYAGAHSKEERRGAEGMYGEAGRYGGINFLSTQIVFNSEKVISESDINVKSSYVVFGTDTEPVKLYGRTVNELEGFHLDNTVTLNGVFTDNENDAELLNERQHIEGSTRGMTRLSDYYDSDNDEEYEGPYRKILSNYDVILSDDFTGVLITSGNVIIEADTNVEGSIIALDRIYVQGNNNIVENRDIAAAIIDYEKSVTDGSQSSEDDTAQDDPDAEFAISHNIMDYIDNIQYQGLFM
ncbi:MAG: hypothetical protein K6G22_10240 [Lachnospiraceae bacterium]|nr:hypothetical protein [Lachnospiraceae bacterium]